MTTEKMSVEQALDLMRDVYMTRAQREAFDTLRAELEGKGWLTLADATPEIGQVVAVNAPGAMMCDLWPARWTGHNFDAGGGWFEQDEVTHWRPMPAPPALDRAREVPREGE